MDKRLVPGRSKESPLNPYKMDEKDNISLINLPNLFKKYSNVTGNGINEIHITFVYASGRSLPCIGQIGLVCDALLTPEISITLSKVLKEYDLNIKSILDIDLFDKLIPEEEKLDCSQKSHLVLCGTGDINIITAEVISYYQEKGVLIRPGQAGPYSADIISYRETTRYSAQFLPNGAFLVAVRNPWWKDRLIIICGGIFGVGTVAALWLLNYYLEGKGEKLGNNIFDDNVPGKIIEGIPKIYNKAFKSVEDLIPQHDIRNLENIDFPLKILE